LGFLQAPWKERIDQEIGIEMNHRGSPDRQSSPCIRHGGLPGMGGRRRQTCFALELPKNLEGRRRGWCHRSRGQSILQPVQQRLLLLRRQPSDRGLDLNKCAHSGTIVGRPTGVNLGRRSNRPPTQNNGSTDGRTESCRGRGICRPRRSSSRQPDNPVRHPCLPDIPRRACRPLRAI